MYSRKDFERIFKKILRARKAWRAMIAHNLKWHGKRLWVFRKDVQAGTLKYSPGNSGNDYVILMSDPLFTRGKRIKKNQFRRLGNETTICIPLQFQSETLFGVFEISVQNLTWNICRSTRTRTILKIFDVEWVITSFKCSFPQK